MPYLEPSIPNPIRFIRYLTRFRYPALPPALFDRYLWFYAELEEAQHQIVYDNIRPTFRLFENMAEGGETRGIAYVEPTGGRLKVLLDALDREGLDDLFQVLRDEHPGESMTVSLPDARLGEYLSVALGWKCSPAAVKFYADHPASPGLHPAREMTIPDERYLADITPRYWPAYQAMLALGYRFFGLFDPQERLVSMCGLVQLTAFRSEIIGVETFAPDQRGKGYARSVCALALKEALALTPFVTWSTRLDNLPSCRTACSLGFQPIYSLYSLTFP